MEFVALPYPYFFLIALTLAWSLRRQRVLRNLALVCASGWFAWKWQPLFLACLVGSSAWNYLAGELLARTSRAHRAITVSAVIGNLALLGYFKYAGFFVDSLDDRAGIAGISMGGHGALTIALEHPERFQAASSVSGVVDLTRAADRPKLVELLGPLQSKRDRWEAKSALQLLERAPERARRLQLRLSCGASDRWIEANRAFHASANQHQVSHDYDEAPAGHEWSYWQKVVPEHVAWHARALAARR